MYAWRDSLRPEKVSLAIKLLLAVIGIGVVQVVLLVMRHLEVRSPDFLVMVKAVIYLSALILLYQLAQGRNWARFVMLAILVIALPLVVLPTLQSFFHFPVYGLLELAQLVLFVLALVLLFQRSSSAWFHQRS